MKQLVVLSGKGGTGKTTIVASFAVFASRPVAVDCDVDAPNLHLLLQPSLNRTEEFGGPRLAAIDEEKCLKCGLCFTVCRFGAITENFKVDPFTCEGCGACTLSCPAEAITMTDRMIGQVFVSRIDNGSMVHALLYPGQANSGRLVTFTRNIARIQAERGGSPLILIDGPPGIGCPVIASLTGTDAALLVIEPTLSGIHDFLRALELLRHFFVRAFVCINKYDINEENAREIEDLCREYRLEVAGRIPFDPVVTSTMLEGKPLALFAPENHSAKEMRKIWEKLRVNLCL